MWWWWWWPFKKKRKIIGHQTTFQAITWYGKYLRGEITRKEWSQLKDKDLRTIRTPIYEDEIK